MGYIIRIMIVCFSVLAFIAGAIVQWGITPKLIMMLCFFCILYFLSVVDVYMQEIPDRCHIFAIGIRFFYYFVFEGFQLKSFVGLIANGISIALPLLLVTLFIEKIIQKETLGGGDIKLVFVTGLYLGWECNLLMLLMACIIGIIIGLVQCCGRDAKLEYFSFGPVIAVATVVCSFFGEHILN